MAQTICNYASCLNDCDNGIVVTLRKSTFDDERRAIFCCASHAAASIFRLSKDRHEATVEIPQRWKST